MMSDVVRRYCEASTIHGFQEFHNSRTICFKIIWVLLISVGTFLTCYLIWNVIVDYKENPMKTLIVPLRDESPRYPPVQICYPHWMYWVNWTKLLEIDLKPETFLYAMSLLMPSFSSKLYNVSERVNIFTEKILPSLNLSSVAEFYIYISNDLPYNVILQKAKRFRREFHDKWYTEFCYTITLQPDQEGIVLRLTFGSNEFRDEDKFVSKYKLEQELQYAARWAYFYSSDGVDAGKEINSSTTIAPFFIYPLNNDDDEFFTVDTSTYFHFEIYLTGTVYRWKNSCKKSCLVTKDEVNFKTFSSTCMRRCLGSYEFSSPFCGLTFENNVTYNVYNSIYSRLPHMSYDHCTSIYSFDNNFLSNETKIKLNNNEFLTLYENCSNSCKPVCEQWMFEKSVVSLVQPAIRNPYCYVIIKYPSRESILVVQELDAYSWEDFVANVGGLLGLWLGASVMSLFQMYTCACVVLSVKY